MKCWKGEDCCDLPCTKIR